jgi:hypothetical protein
MSSIEHRFPLKKILHIVLPNTCLGELHCCLVLIDPYSNALVLHWSGCKCPRGTHCRKVKFNCPLPGSPSGRPLIEAPNRAVLASSWNGYEGVLDYLIGIAIMVVLVRVFPTGVFLSHHVVDDIGLDVTRDSCPWVACRFYLISPSAGGA